MTKITKTTKTLAIFVNFVAFVMTPWRVSQRVRRYRLPIGISPGNPH